MSSYIWKRLGEQVNFQPISKQLVFVDIVSCLHKVVRMNGKTACLQKCNTHTHTYQVVFGFRNIDVVWTEFLLINLQRTLIIQLNLQFIQHVTQSD